MPIASRVRALLSAFNAQSTIEREYKREMLALCDTPTPFSRDQYKPGHFTASAFVLSSDRSALLLIHHAKLLRWLQPGGHVEASDETLVAAATREVMEECLLESSELELMSDQPFDLDIHVIPERRDEPQHLHFDVRFLYRCLTDHARASDEVLGVDFVPLDQIDDRQSDESVMRAVGRLRAIAVG